jgi:hypothetical protein
MKKIICLFFIALWSAGFASAGWGQEKRVITLSDGTRISGQIVSYSSGLYTVRTENLGEFKIEDSSVVSISSGSTAPAKETPAAGGLQADISQVQTAIMSNPEMMQDIEKLLADPDIMNLLADKNFINDIMSQDPARIQANPKTRQFMNNPAIKEMMETMIKQMGPDAFGR